MSGILCRSILTARLFALIAFVVGTRAWAQSPPGPIRVEVDETRAPQKLLHSHLQIPVRPGPLVLYYPRWIPGDHQPSGPIINMVGLKFTANGKALPWRRDLDDLFALHLDIPEHAVSLDVDFDFLLTEQADPALDTVASATAYLNVVNWNQVVLYPKGYDAANLIFSPSLRIPTGWKFGTALPTAKQDGDTIAFLPVSLEVLIDSPVISGRFFRAIDLTPGQTPDHEIDIAADSAAALAMTSETQQRYGRLIAEAGALFGARHYRDYHFLVTLSDVIAQPSATFGLEHHESSDNRILERGLTDKSVLAAYATLLPHEYVHSWNGKYRRPADLLSPDYQQPMKDDLLWVYEGLTEYLGTVLAVRSDLRSEEHEREELARVSALLDAEPGRAWRPLQDTADAAVFLAGAGTDWQNWRRGTDYYEEGMLLWLDVDGTIRRLTQDHKSLDDFCRLFFAGANGQPDLKPYGFEDVIAALNEVAPYDWAMFLRSRLDSVASNTPDEALHGSGWKLVYDDVPNEALNLGEKISKESHLDLSIGFTLSANAAVEDVVYDGPSYKAGIGPGAKITRVNGRKFSAAALKDAIKAAEVRKAPIQLTSQYGSDVQVHMVDYHGGLRYPHLVRDDTHPDFLSEILKSLVP